MAAAITPLIGRAMEIQWTRMAGQWPVESSPLVGEISQPGKTEILVLNRGGQLMLWSPDGKDIGSGQDGLVAQLPQGRWTTAPTLVDGPTGARLIIASVEGLIVGLDKKFQILWQHKLAGKTGWGRVVPARLQTSSGLAYAFGDGTGTVTCLTPTGVVAWTNALGAGPIEAPLRSFVRGQSEEHLLIAAGSTVLCLDSLGHVRWRCDLGKEIMTPPEVLSLPNRKMILCGNAAGSLFGISPEGQILWECATGDIFNNSIAFLPRANAAPLILCPGLWGNLHAIDVEGRHVWTHLFRAKTRATPLVVDALGDGHPKIFLPTFHQHVYAFDEKGGLADDLRLSGIMPSALTPILDPATGRTDLLVTTTTLLAYRLRPGEPKSPYGKTGVPQQVSLQPPSAGEVREASALQVRNPHGALINVKLSMTDTNDWTRIVSSLAARSAFEIALPSLVRTGAWSLRATAQDAAGHLLDDKSWKLPLSSSIEPKPALPGLLRAWSTPPFGSFEETRLAPFDNETEPGREQEVTLQNLYQDEAEQGAFIIASTRDDAVRCRVTLTNLVRKDGAIFAGANVLRQVIATGSVNGERVPDALPKLGDAGLVTIPPRRSVKIWVSADSRGSAPGNYKGRITISPLNNEAEKFELPLAIEVLNLRLPQEPPLTLCTWDYVPNRWFPTRSKEVLDDMSGHGVNVFPRSTIPAARVDTAGHLTIDWSTLDAELERLHGRGKILFHLNHPPIEFAGKKTDEEKRPVELAYIHALRDHLRERGWGYVDYAFYLLDEPGLDYGPNVAILIDAGQLFREADPKLRTYTDPVPGLSWKDFERIEPLVDVWAPNMRLVSGLLSGDPRIKRIMNAKTVWSYECVSQVKSLSPLRYNRANAWRAKFFGLSGIGFWTHSTTEVDHWFAGKTVNDEYALVYPGELPVPSVRWEAVRDGLEDVAAITLLEHAIEQHRKAGTNHEQVKQAEEELRIALRDIMELSDEAFVESRDYLRAGDRVLGHTWTDLETLRRHRSEIARLTLALTKPESP
ncbi:MAG: DUF4091 domain-containing protein [Verrucomicrobia bacterium]|nr:DUF4091 domain-containing protein [Verrucomicrobiota bacterium]